MEQTDHLTEADLSVDREVISQLAETAKWTKFIGITLFIFCGLMIIAVLAASASFSRVFDRFNSSLGINSDDLGILVAVIIVVALFICVLGFCLVNFAAKIKAGIEMENTETFNKGLNSMKLYFLIGAIVGILGLISNMRDLLNYF